MLQLQLSSSNKMTYQLLPGPIRRQGCSVALHNSLADLLCSIPLVLYPWVLTVFQLVIYLINYLRRLAEKYITHLIAMQTYFEISILKMIMTYHLFVFVLGLFPEALSLMFLKIRVHQQ